MKPPTRFPLLAKVLGWLMLHLIILALGFFLFVKWQLDMGLDSLLSGSAGERLHGFGDEVAACMDDLPPEEWNREIANLARKKDVRAALFQAPMVAEASWKIPPNVVKRARASLPPLQPPLPPRRPHRGPR